MKKSLKAMKTNLKKFFVIAMIAVLGISVTPVSAAPGLITTNPDKSGTTDTASLLVNNTATLTVSNVASGDKLSAYKIIDIFYNATTNELTYEFTDTFSAFLTAEGLTKTVADYIGDSTEVDTTLISQFTTYVKKNAAAVTGTALTMNGTTGTATLEVGAYLVLPTAATRVYAPMVGNVAVVAENNAWVIKDAEVVAKSSQADIEKGISTSDDKSESYNIGDTFNYQVKATVPQFPAGATNKKYIVRDKMSTGLTLGALSTFTVKDGTTSLNVNTTTGVVTDDAGNTVTTIVIADNGFTMSFDLNYITSTTIEVNYEAQLNEHAVLGVSGNNNGISLEFSNDPFGGPDGSTSTVDKPSETKVITYGLRVVSHEKNNQSTLLPNAVFDVCTDSACTNSVGRITTGADGSIEKNGIKEGTYYLKEISAPTGYSLIKDPITVVISETADAEDGTKNGVVEVLVPHTKLSALPITGGMGTIIFTVSGAILMVGAVWFVFMYKRKNNSQEA